MPIGIGTLAYPHRMPELKLPSFLIVVMAFDLEDDGVLQLVFEPRQMPDEPRAVNTARNLDSRHAGRDHVAKGSECRGRRTRP